MKLFLDVISPGVDLLYRLPKILPVVLVVLVVAAVIVALVVRRKKK